MKDEHVDSLKSMVYCVLSKLAEYRADGKPRTIARLANAATATGSALLVALDQLQAELVEAANFCQECGNPIR